MKRVGKKEVNLETPDSLNDNYFDAIYGVSVLHHLDLEKALPVLIKKLKPGAFFAFSEPNLLNPINKYLYFTNDQNKRRKFGVSPNEMAFTPNELRLTFEKHGLNVEKVFHRDFLHPQTPKVLIPIILAGQFFAERLPAISLISGSLWICGEKTKSVYK